ncbi:type IV secretory system conjugative DNA transfer family protein [Caballeronia sp. LP003]|uniref:type IV secretory system conjugative DNA transfer family protein n=1 Tax=Caballeronia sp. LP003 TaxID=3038551 RepID=UPI00285C7223|nr:type IV secretory system conjugative DNA transfer family protein [Caballeronia sp. LP003]MDR5791707.1 type IV secretory system conjugative DNA transfer family protein [Caballeronia sp. LP003]
MLAGMLISSVVATQYFAAKVQYSPYLGVALHRFATWTLYPPYDWLVWGWSFSDVGAVSERLHMMLAVAVGGAFISILSAIVAIYGLFAPNRGMEELHGSAHWASTNEVDATGLLGSASREVSGTFVGSVMLDSNGDTITPANPVFHDRYLPRMDGNEQARDKEGRPLWKPNPSVLKSIEYLRDDGPTHTLVFAPTRSGKGRGIIIPSLFAWKHSVIVNDQKGENYALTSGMRKAAGQIVFKFEPTCLDGTTACWNPLAEIRKFTIRDVADAQNIMAAIVDPESKGMEDHWIARAWELLTALALHSIYAEKDKSLAGMAMYLGDPSFDSDIQMWNRMLNAVHDPDNKMGWLDTSGNPTRTHPVVANAARAMLNTPDEERGSVLSTAKRCLTLFLDPVVAKNTSRSDFCVRDLMTLDKPVSCYYIPNEEDMARLQPLSRLFFMLVIQRNVEKMEANDGRMVAGIKHRLLMLIDEFPALRKIEIIQHGLGYVAGYGIKLMLICQDLLQLTDIYGQHQTIVAGCHIRIAYAPADDTTAERLEKMVGTTTITEDNENVSYNRMGFGGGNVSVSRGKTSRPLLTQSEFQSLSPEDMVIFVVNNQPIYGRKVKYDEIPQFAQWSKMRAPAMSDRPRFAVEDPVTDNPTDATIEEVGQKPSLNDDERQIVNQLLSSDFAVPEVIAISAF